MDSFVKNSVDSRPASSPFAPRRRFDFEHDTLLIDGRRFTLLVTVYGLEDFELWNLDADRPADFDRLHKVDQRAILDRICKKFSDESGYRPGELVGGNRAEVTEMNAQNGWGR